MASSFCIGIGSAAGWMVGPFRLQWWKIVDRIVERDVRKSTDCRLGICLMWRMQSVFLGV
jgi:hypothetical protein